MSSGTPKGHKTNSIKSIKTPSQKSVEEKTEKSNPQSLYKKNLMPNFIERNEINEKNFPQKANYFNDKMNSIHSPIIDYFSSSFYYQKYHSPEEINHANKNSYINNQIYNNVNRSVDQNFLKSPMEQNFNFSPSNIFNKNNNNINSNNIKQNNSSNNSLNNLKLQTEKSNEEEDNKTLQERIGILLGKNESNNLLYTQKNNNMNINNNINPMSNMGFINNNNYFNFNNNNNINNNLNNVNNNIITNNNATNPQQNEDEFENQDEVYILNFNNEDENDKDIEDETPNIKIEHTHKIQNIINENKKEKNNINNNNKFRNNIKEQINNIINTGENDYPSYEGNIYFNSNISTNNNNTNNNTVQTLQNMSMPNNINNTTNNIFYPTMNNNIIYSPINFGYFPYGFYNNNINNQNNINLNNNNNYYQNKIGQFSNMPLMPNNNYNNNKGINNKFINNNNFSINNERNINNSFYYNGDQYQIFNNNKNNRNNNNNINKEENKYNINNNNSININLNSKEKNIYTIGPKDLVTTITSNKKKIKRVNPKAYLEESYEYLSHNIFILAKDQAGCRFLQEKIEKDPVTATSYFYEAIQPYLTTLVKDPFGNYLVQKIIKNLDEKKIKKILEIISKSIVDISINNHGTRVVQFLVNFLTTKELQNYFIEMIRPHTIHLLKELNGAHIIQKLLLDYPESCFDLNKIIIENCSYLATHKHGCCVLQKFLDGNYKNLEEDLIKNLVNNCLVLIADQFGNYVIQSILLLKNEKINSEIAKKIIGNIHYYSKHRYSSNVVEKCFDLCNAQDKKIFVEKLSSPEIVAELILDDHGNYVIQKVLQCADEITKENILKNIIPLIPKIKGLSFGERLLNKLYASYPQLNGNIKKKNNFGFYNNYCDNNNEQEKIYKNRKIKK